MNNIKLIMDTDIGSDIDDALCLAYLLNQPNCELLGITTCSSEPQKRAEIADSICQYFKMDIPVFPGRDMPILGKQLQTAVHQYDVVKQLIHRSHFPENHAVDFMREMIETYPQQVILLAVGPLTNIGALFTAFPHLIPMTKEVVFMGGSYFSEAVSFIAEEWNIKNDPIAAKIVLDSGVPVRAVGLDVTLKVKIECANFISTNCVKALEPVVLYARKFLERTNDMYFHDPLAAACLFDDKICSFKRGHVHIGIGSDWGRTYFIESPYANTRIAEQVNSEHFFQHYNEIMNYYKGN